MPNYKGFIVRSIFKNLIKSFQLLDESYKEDIYRANIKIIYNEAKTKDFLGKKNISFSNPENISAVFFPLLYINGEIQDLDRGPSLRVGHRGLHVLYSLVWQVTLDWQDALMRHGLESFDCSSR